MNTHSLQRLWLQKHHNLPLHSPFFEALAQSVLFFVLFFLWHQIAEKLSWSSNLVIFFIMFVLSFSCQKGNILSGFWKQTFWPKTIFASVLQFLFFPQTACMFFYCSCCIGEGKHLKTVLFKRSSLAVPIQHCKPLAAPTCRPSWRQLFAFLARKW